MNPFAHEVARLRIALQVAQQRHQTVQAAVAKIEARIDDCRARQAAITQARLEGAAAPESAAEFAGLATDLESLTRLWKDARTAAARLDPDAERQALSRAEDAWRQQQITLRYQAVAERSMRSRPYCAKQSVPAMKPASRRVISAFPKAGGRINRS